MPSFMFASQLWSPPEGYEPPAITHPDPGVMRLVKAMMDADPDSQSYEYTVQGATQGVLYYEIPYCNQIAHFIRLAVAAKEALEAHDEGD